MGLHQVTLPHVGEVPSCPHLLQHSHCSGLGGGENVLSGVRWCLSCLVASEAAETGSTSALSSNPSWWRAVVSRPRSGGRCPERRSDSAGCACVCGCVPCSVTTGVTAQPCCAQQPPQGHRKPVCSLAFTGAVLKLGASTGACSCLGETPGCDCWSCGSHVGGGSGRRPLLAPVVHCWQGAGQGLGLASLRASGVCRLSVLTLMRTA